MRVGDATTGNTGVWITFLLVAALYTGLGVTTILVLRGMSRRYREQSGGGEDDTDVPYGPNDGPLLPGVTPPPAPEEVGAR
jgi:cytochrome d ubiquinol oxidase subunit I